MLLGLEEFKRLTNRWIDATRIEEASTRLRDWEGWNRVENSKEDVYLCRKKVVEMCLNVKIGKETDDDDEEEDMNVSRSEESDASLARVSAEDTEDRVAVLFEYHILLCPTYRVPTMYFKAELPSRGRRMTIKEIWASMPSHYRTPETASRWAFVTQEEHPVLGRPFFCIHPCHTAEIMLRLLESKRVSPFDGRIPQTYLLAWFSLIAPVVHLQPPSIEEHKALEQKLESL